MSNSLDLRRAKIYGFRIHWDRKLQSYYYIDKAFPDRRVYLHCFQCKYFLESGTCKNHSISVFAYDTSCSSFEFREGVKNG